MEWLLLHRALISEALTWHARQRSLGGTAVALVGDSMIERLRGTRLGVPYPPPPLNLVIPDVFRASGLALRWPVPLPLGIGGDQTQALDNAFPVVVHALTFRAVRPSSLPM